MVKMKYKQMIFILLANMCSAFVMGQQVSQERMARIYDEVRTPYKYGMVIAPADNNHKIDCPTVFREGNSWYMTYVCYNGSGGTDGRGYETWIAKSEDLLHWETLGRVLAFPEKKTWDENQRGGFPALIDWEWGGSYKMQTYKGRHWMTYIGGPGTGYEAVNAPLSIGLASTKNGVTTAHQWDTYDKPIMSYDDKDAQWWERMTQYKSTIYKMDKKRFGYPFVMYYNAGGKDDMHPKGERIGIALSKDLKKWKRYDGNPVFAHDSDGTITGDAQIVKMDDVYVMFYFSAFNPTREYNAFNTFAASYDLVNWTDWEGEDLIIPSKPYDEMFAHKSYVVKHDGTVYHFYCAVNNAGQRGIALATSKHKGQSEVNFCEPEQTGHRKVYNLNNDWEITFEGKTFHKDIPYNLDDYYGAVQKEHGNLHGNAIFKKVIGPINLNGNNKQAFIRFEGVGTYADITLNGANLGHYAIGRCTEMIDVTKYLRDGGDNELIVKVSHPAGITDMPWVCGGCSSEWGFSEGSQPFGIFRPVTLEITDDVRVEPFGVHVWNNVSADSIFIETEVRNYSDAPTEISLINKLCDKSGKQAIRLTENIILKAGETRIIKQQSAVDNPILWSIDNPYLYNVNTIIKRNGKATDSENTPYGIRTTSWPLTRNDGDKRFYLNNQPVLINGTCEYEHLFGQSHAFTNEQIDARIKEVRMAGFNAFRDAHQPHNLRYGKLIDESGLLWWPQFSAHIWYDTPQFRDSFKKHLVQWVKERRNSPSIILWGLQNESTLPADFAEECADIIRSMDPMCGSQRLVTTCNGGVGTDWNVVQNWSGTYGGNVYNYGEELKRDVQLLNGEYGAWRTLGNHSGYGYTEEKMCDLLELKSQLAESVRDSVCGQFQWLLNSHDNPGRRQPDEAFRRVDKVGPFNYKGLFSPWEQPADVFYMYRSRYIPASADPMVYIVPNICKDSLRVYSNCDKVVLKVGGKEYSPENRKNSSLKVFRNITLSGESLTVDAYYNGKIAATQSVRLSGEKFDESILKPTDGYTYIYNVNCGGDDYTDSFGTTWKQDYNGYSTSWGERFISESITPYQTSQTSNHLLPVSKLFRTSRFGRHELSYRFPVPEGKYRVELYFIEPWYGVGASETSDFEGMRLFDVAVNGETKIKNLDLWAQSHYGHPYKRVVYAEAKKGMLVIDFPKVKVGQAIISAIAIAEATETAKDKVYNAAAKDVAMVPSLSWASFDTDTIVKMPDSLLPEKQSTALEVEPVVGKKSVKWTYSVGVAKVYALRFRYWNPEKARDLHVKITDKNGVVYVDSDVAFLQTQEKKTKRKTTSITTGTQTNAGTYTVVLTGEGLDKMLFDNLTIE